MSQKKCLTPSVNLTPCKCYFMLHLSIFFITIMTVDDMNQFNEKEVAHYDTALPSAGQSLLVSFHLLFWFYASISPVLFPDTVCSCFYQSMYCTLPGQFQFKNSWLT